MKRWLWLVLATCVLLAPGEPAQAARFISIGTGGINGVYYPVGGAICRLVNQNRKTHGIRCSVEATGGSVYNVKNVLSREFEFGLAQSDVQWRAWNGAAPFAAKETKLEQLIPYFQGPTAVAFHRKDVVGLAKLLTEVAKTNPNVAFKAALIEGKVVPTSEIQSIASMPSREVMLGKLLFLLKAPLQRLATVLKAPVRDLGLVLKQVKK